LASRENAIIKEGDKDYLFSTFMGRWRKITAYVFGWE